MSESTRPDALFNTDETDVVKRAKNGEASAQRQLFDAHVNRVHSLAFRMCWNNDTADDLTQDTFVRAFRQLPRFRGDAPFGAWLHRIATSVILNGLRAQRRRAARELPFEAAASASKDTSSADPTLGDALERALALLTVESRLIVILHEIEGYTPQEIGRMTSTLPGTVRVRLARAKAQLRKLLQPYGEQAQ